MSVNKIGLVIKTLRKKRGLTQQQLAEKLGITDKAVSKWERGLGIPDVLTINELANTLNIDADNLLAGNVAYLENEWVGELRLDKFQTNISITTEIYGKPSVYFYFCYFALAGIKEVYIYCSVEEREIMRELIGNGDKYGFNLRYNESEDIKIRKKMVIEGPVFLYGPNLTKYFQRGMSRKNAQISLIIPCVDKNKDLVYLDGKNQVSDTFLNPQGYQILPIRFDFENSNNIEYEPMGKGMIAIEISKMDDVLAISNLLHILSNYSGEQIYCLEEIAYRRGMIGKKSIKEICC